MKLGIAEVLRKASAETGKAKIELLRRNDSASLRLALIFVYNRDYRWDFPEGWVPDYRPSRYLDQEGVLHNQIRKMGKFMVDGYPGLSREKKMVLFVQLLESVTPDDAALLIGIKDGKMPWKGLGKKVVAEALPGLADHFPEEKNVAEL